MLGVPDRTDLQGSADVFGQAELLQFSQG